MDIKTWVLDTGERAVSTFIGFAVTLLVAGQAIDMSFAHQLATAGVAAVWVVILNAFPSLNFSYAPDTLQDVLARAGKSFIQASGALLVAAGSGWYVASVWQSAGIAGGAAAWAVIKSWLASRRPNSTVTPASVAPGHPIMVEAREAVSA